MAEQVILEWSDIEPLSREESRFLEKLENELPAREHLLGEVEQLERQYGPDFLTNPDYAEQREPLVEAADEMDRRLQVALQEGLEKHILREISSRIHVVPYEQPGTLEAKMNTLIMEARDKNVEGEKLLDITAEIYELLFDAAYADKRKVEMTETPVDTPFRQLTAQRTGYDHDWNNTVVCLLLRGALFPGLVIGREIEKRSGIIPEYAAFSIHRSHHDKENLQYVLETDDSHFDAEALKGKDLIFPDPMLATAGSMIAIVKLLKEKEVDYKSITFLGAIGAYEGAITLARNVDGIEIHLGALDANMNHKGYILPGSGDYSDRAIGKEKINATQLMKNLPQKHKLEYKNQIEAVKETIRTAT